MTRIAAPRRAGTDNFRAARDFLLRHRLNHDTAYREADAPTTCSRASDYRISPFELESVLLEHDAVAEAAVVPSPDLARFVRVNR